MNWEEIYPPFGLTIRLGPVEMHPVRFDDIPVLLDLIADGVVADDVPSYPLASPFALGEDTIERRRDSVRFWWSTWLNAKPDRWSIPMAVLRDGVIAGVQDVGATDFPTVRSIETGSFLGVRHQGKGTGTLMRQAMCMFAFDHLGAREMHSEASHDNPRSLGVSRKVGYVENGRHLTKRGDGTVDTGVRVRLLPEQLNRPDFPLEVEGLEPFLRFLNIDPAG